MNAKERALVALNHRQPDKVPIDFGAHGCSMMHVSCIEALRKHYGLSGLVKVSDPSTMTGVMEEDLRDAMGVDFEGIFPYTNFFGYHNEGWKEWDYFGQKVLVPELFEADEDGKGGYLLYPQGDRTAPPSGHMPAGGFYFDTLIRQEPFDDIEDLDYRDNLEEFGPISRQELDYYAAESKRLQSGTRAIVGNFGYTSLGDISGVPAPGLKYPKGIRNVEDWYMAPLLNADYIHSIYEAQSNRAIENLQAVKEAVGNNIDVAFVCGTDFGTQISLMASTEVFKEIWFPYYKKMNDWIHRNTNWKTFKHTCGAVYELLPLLIDAGFDIVNPVQCSAAGMDPQRLKKDFGDSIVFWGAGVDTQEILPFGTPKQVREQVLSRCEIFAPGGGFVFNAIHCVQCGTPVENIVAMIDAVHEFNG